MTHQHYDPPSNKLLLYWNTRMNPQEDASGYCHFCGLICHPTSWHWKERASSVPLLMLCDHCLASADTWKRRLEAERPEASAYSIIPVRVDTLEPALWEDMGELSTRRGEWEHAATIGGSQLFITPGTNQGWIRQASPPQCLATMAALVVNMADSPEPENPQLFPPKYGTGLELQWLPMTVTPLCASIIQTGMVVSVAGVPMIESALMVGFKQSRDKVWEALHECREQGWISSRTRCPVTGEEEWFLTTLGFAVGEWLDLQGKGVES